MKYVSAEQYSKLTGMGVEEVKKAVRTGKINGFITDGGRFKIQYYENETESYEQTIRENEALKQGLRNIQMQLFELMKKYAKE